MSVEHASSITHVTQRPTAMAWMRLPICVFKPGLAVYMLVFSLNRTCSSHPDELSSLTQANQLQWAGMEHKAL